MKQQAAVAATRRNPAGAGKAKKKKKKKEPKLSRLAAPGDLSPQDWQRALCRQFGSAQSFGLERVILAGTELSLAFDEATCGFPALDCARAHLDAIVARALAPMPA